MSQSTPIQHIISINPDRCQGHSRCCMLAPELFESDDLGYGLVRGDGHVPQALLDKAKLAVANCPEFAITMKKVQS
jgi:ferredoxin